MSFPYFPSAFFLVIFADFAYAQDPIGQLGPWPPGAFTLLAGLWLSINALSESRFDVLPPIVFARILHKIPLLRRFLTSDGKSGALVKQLVLTSENHSGRLISQEWDTLILQKPPRKSPKHGESTAPLSPDSESSLIPTAEVNLHDPYAMHLWFRDGGKSFDFRIKTGVADLSKLEGAFDKLMRGLDFDVSEPKFDRLLQFWHALRMYQQYPEQREWFRPLDEQSLKEAISYYRRYMRPDASPSHEPSCVRGLYDTMLKVHYPDSKYDFHEVPEGAMTMNEGVSAKHLAVMLAFTEYVCGDITAKINPLILCIWIWYSGKQHSHDNLLFKLPPSQRFVFPQRESVNSAQNLLDLSSNGWEIDGGHSRHEWFVGVWCFSLLTSSLIAFFSIVSGGTSPNMAATLALLLVRPYSMDSYIFTDAGYPPSWTGRRQIRWGSDWACSVFRGRFYRKMGAAGNSIFRATFAYAVAWVSWYFRLRLRQMLQFPPPDSPPYWVTTISIGLEIASAFLSLVITLVHLAKRQYKPAVAIAMLTTYIAYDIYATVYFKTPARWILLSEMGLLAAVPYAALIPRGVGPSYRPFVFYNFLIWCHIIASSCIYDHVEATK